MIKSKIIKDEFSKQCRYYTTSRYQIRIKEDELEMHFELIKDLFYDRLQYKWKVKKAITYINDQLLSKYDVSMYLRDFIKVYAETKSKNEKYIDFRKFIENIQNNPKIQPGPLNYSRLVRLKKDVDINLFLEDFHQLRNHLESKHSNLIKMIYENISLPYTIKTFTRLYYDSVISERE